MRESRTFAERAKVLKSDEARKKYFLVYEGSDTEVIYFDAICALREDIGISPLIELIPIIRSFSEEGWSNPKKILDRVIENLQESKESYISYESLLNRIMDYLYETRVITTSRVLAKNIWKTMQEICSEQLQKSLYDKVDDIENSCKKVLDALKNQYEVVNIVGDISGIIREGGLTYEEGFDQICLIVDRDRESFLSKPENNQYKYVLDKEKLLENPRVTSKRRYVEDKLREFFPGYSKSSYRAEPLVRDVDRAIENEKRFCEDIVELEYSVGSNIGRLLSHIRG